MDAKTYIHKNVSRETFEKFEIYAALLQKWQKSINLVANSTLSDIWGRHFQDSVQMTQYIGISDKIIADLGSGGGFPGMVLAICGFPSIHLIESDQRKCAFLRDVSRETSTPVTIHNKRIENLELKADIISSRAFADLGKTLEISSHLRHKKTEYFLLKGESAPNELTESAEKWQFESQSFASLSDPRGCIIHLRNISERP